LGSIGSTVKVMKRYQKVAAAKYALYRVPVLVLYLLTWNLLKCNSFDISVAMFMVTLNELLCGMLDRKSNMALSLLVCR